MAKCKKSDCGILGSLLIPALCGFCLYLIFTSINQSNFCEGLENEVVPEIQDVQVCFSGKGGDRNPQPYYVPQLNTNPDGSLKWSPKSTEHGNIKYPSRTRVTHYPPCREIGKAKQLNQDGIETKNDILCEANHGVTNGKCVECGKGTIPDPKQIVTDYGAATGLVEGDFHLKGDENGLKVERGGVECIKDI
jgi:hypothetical protein